MISRTSPAFRKRFRHLPTTVQRQDRAAYQLWGRNPYHPSLQFKRVHPTDPIYSVRVGRTWRAVGLQREDQILWFWIGSHADYDDLLQQL